MRQKCVRNKAFIILLFGIVSVMLFFISRSILENQNENLAIVAADQYLLEKYQMEVDVLSVVHRKTENHGLGEEYYDVIVKPLDEPTVEFRIVIDARDFSPVSKNNTYLIPDNYIQSVFQSRVYEEVKKCAEESWGDDVEVEIYLFDRFQNTEGLDCKLSLGILSTFIEYEVRIATNIELQDSNFATEAIRIVQLFNGIKQIELADRRFIITYLINGRPYSYSFEKWKGLSLDEVENQLKKYYN